MGWMCSVCRKIFAKNSNLIRHRRKVHQLLQTNSYAIKSGNYKCLEEGCNNSYDKNKGLVNHLMDIHNFNFNTEEIQFNNYNEFESWKTIYETENNCNYTVAHTWKSNVGRVTHYNCNRTKTSKKQKQNRSRQLKSQGSCKLDFACTSYFKLIRTEETLTVQFQKRHYGHSPDLQHIRISKYERGSIASKLIAGVTKSRIVDSVRDKIEESLKCIDLLTLKDVDNIQRSYNIEARDGKRHKNDAVSVDLYVQECNAMPAEENPVIFYKKQGEESDILSKTDFCLVVLNNFQQNMLKKFGSNVILIDGTHGLNNYDFELTTIMVIDEFGQGFPSSFMFSNRKDSMIYNVFFRSISKKMGKITAKTFMSDITETFYTGWKQVMGPVSYRLYCSWHIDRAWQKNLTKIVDREKRKNVYHTLKVLQEELNEDQFQTKMIAALNLMLDDQDTHNFGQYFNTNYTNNCKQWAYCYRINTGINTNMRLESMHKTIKYFYLNRKFIKRLDKGLHAVLKYVRDQSTARIVKLIKGKNTVSHQKIFKRHQFAVSSQFTVQNIDSDSWELKSGAETYLVNKMLYSNCCRLICSECKICIHVFSCTCDDHFQFCKHIHFLILHEQNLENKDSNDVIMTLDSYEDNERFVNLLCRQKQGDKNLNLINKINQTFTKLQTYNLNALDQSVISELFMHLTILNNLIDLPGPCIFEQINCNTYSSSNKNINPQMRFTSTQKKRKSQEINKKPNKKTTISISNMLSGTPDFFISESPINDHMYF